MIYFLSFGGGPPMSWIGLQILVLSSQKTNSDPGCGSALSVDAATDINRTQSIIKENRVTINLVSLLGKNYFFFPIKYLALRL